MKTKYFSVLLLFTFQLLWVIPNSFSRNSRVVSIPDANLEAVIRNALRLNDGRDMTQLDLLNLTRLTADNRHITDLTGLESAENLEYLSLSSNQITDVSALAALTNLKVLVISFNRIRDFSPLAGLTELRNLHIEYNLAEDLTPIQALTQLQVLSVRGFNLRNATLDLNLFAAFPNLIRLDIGSNGIRDITPLTQLKGLVSLFAWGNEIQDLTPIAQMPGLEVLELADNRIDDLTPLRGSTNLQYLTLFSNPITDLTPISGLVNLKRLNIAGDADGGDITDLTPIAGLTHLEFLQADRNKIRNLRPLRKLTQLETLSLRDNKIIDVRPLTKLVNLTQLFISRNSIADITPIQVLSTQNPRLEIDIDLTQLLPVVTSGGSRLPALYWIDTVTSGFYRINSTQQTVEHTISAVSNMTSLAIDTRGNRAYWIQQHTEERGEIGSANLDGSAVGRVRWIYGLPLDLAIDPVRKQLYATNANGRILRLNLNTGNFKANLIANLNSPKYIAVDTLGRLYWSEADARIRRANPNGSNVETLITGLGTLGGLTVTADKLYWTEHTSDNTGDIRTANLDGTNVQTLATLRSRPLGIAVDTNGRKVYWTSAAGKIQRANLNGRNIQNVVTGLVNPIDLVFGTDANTRPFSAAPAIVLPDTTGLLPNYPNPFNPETWIPYQLAKSVEVTLHIYGIDGGLVRTLALGHQSVGSYKSRSRAAYWDGRNESGEPVASGVYFYTLTAGDVTATRKMLIRK